MTEEEKNEYYRSLAERIVKDVQENPCKLDSEIFKEIEKLERRKPILLVGKDRKLIKHAVNWIHLTHPKVYRHIGRNVSLLARYSDNPISPVISSIENRTIILSEYSCIGKTEQKIEDDLFSPDCSFISDYKSGEMLFVRGLNSKRILERLADSVEPSGSGVLIVNVPGMDIVPQEILGQFDPIYLEPQKKVIPASTPQDTVKQAKFIPFPTPSGTQWHEVGISFIDRENVKISARDKTATKHFFDMGFRKGNTCKPVKSWHTLFAFSEKRCLKYSQSIKSKTEKDIQDLRRRLKAYFGIQDDPIILDQGYKPVFKVCGSESEGRSVRAFSNSAIFDEKEND